MADTSNPIWFFTNNELGAFEAPNAQYTSKLYFPLMNEKGMKTYVTPELKGDILIDFQRYLSVPNVTEDLHRQAPGRNFWVHIQGQLPWSVSGMSVFQKSQQWQSPEKSSVQGKPGVFKLKREHLIGLCAETTLFVAVDENVEIMQVKLVNNGNKALQFKTYNATPLYGRSADNVRDHRQVTTMFQETYVDSFGVRIKPRMVHDERGHVENNTQYVAYGFDGAGNPPEAFWPSMLDFIGEGGSLENPEAIFKEKQPQKQSMLEVSGEEAIGAFRFAETVLQPSEQITFTVLHGIGESLDEVHDWEQKYNTSEKVEAALEKTATYWKNLTENITIQTSDTAFNNLFKWVIYQVKCRQVFGNSYLPDYGYGRGGRGWRDLWQDLLAVFLVDPDSARQEIYNNFLGIRFDGSNATIIGDKSGEFKADRNNIPRTWSDHGAWPVFVTNFYLQQTGDFSLLLEELPYWKDQFVYRSKQTDTQWDASQGNKLQTTRGEVYTGTIFEHVLMQQLSSFYNVGQHNIVLLEGADWNDTYDMSAKHGESVCFHHFYAGNLALLIQWLKALQTVQKVEEISLSEDMLPLLDRLTNNPVDYGWPAQKRKRLEAFYEATRHRITEKKQKVLIADLISDLEAKASHMKTWVQENEWIEEKDLAFYNGHYDDFGHAFDGNKEGQIRIDLTSQVMPIMSGTATSEQIPQMLQSIQRLLKDPEKNGFRLCTDFGGFDTRYGRVSGFVYGFKEHGSRWLQQNVMLAYGLYGRGFAAEAYGVFKQISQLMEDSGQSKIFPGIPSFIDKNNRGAYNYLTGSSSWLMMLVVTQMFGVRGENGGLRIQPKLADAQFDEKNQASIKLVFSNKQMEIVFVKSTVPLTAGELIINGQVPEISYSQEKGWLIDKENVQSYFTAGLNKIRVFL